MSVINVNSFESRVSNKNFLTNYTDPYLKQSLANLGQRLSVKGDSVVSDKFVVSDLFTNYLGDLSTKNTAIEFTYLKEENSVVGKIVEISDDGKRTVVGSGESSESGSTITIGSANNVLQNLTSDDYPSEIYLSDSNGVNGSSYWHRGSAKIARMHDDKIGKDVLVYKIVGHHDAGNYGEYDNELICEEVTVDGEFVEGFRIFMSNEENLMIRDRENEIPSGQDGFLEGEHENLVMLRLRKSDKQWILDCYKCTQNDLEIGEISKTTDDDIWVKISDNYDSDGTLTSSQLMSQITESYTETNLMVTSNGSALFTKSYSLYIEENTEENVGWIVKSWNRDPSDASDMCDNVGTNPNDDDYDDHTLIEQKLEYFVNDVTEVFPAVLSVYDQVMYHDESNLKLKMQVMSQLVLQLMSDSSKQNGATSSELQEEYSIIMPVDFQVNYNYNSNDSSIIYNSLSPVVVSFLSLGTDDKPGEYISDSLKKIWNDVDEDGNKVENTQVVFANGYESKTAQYDFIINYITDDTISSINWNPSFVLPYIDNKGFWVVNDIKTDQYARSIDNSSADLVIVNCDDKDNFRASDAIIFGSDYLKNTDNWEKKTFIVNYSDGTVNVGGGTHYTMSAWLPSDELLNEISGTDDFSYISGSIFMCSSSMDMEVNDDSTSDNLSDILGQDTRITSFWTAVQKTEGNAKTWSMEYLTVPGTTTSLDFAWLISLPNYIKHYAKSSFSPDNYKNRWVVFNDISVDLKNNTKDNNRRVNPVIRNYDSTYFSASLSSSTRAFGGHTYTDSEIQESEEREKANQQYKNNLNFSIEFSDNVRSYNGVISYTTNTFDGRHFHIDKYTYTYQNPITYIGMNSDGKEMIKVSKENVYKEYGTIPSVIEYANYKNEFTPNGIYNANDDDLTNRYQYPILDTSEVLIRNINSLNRYNVIGVDRVKFQNGIEKSVLMNAYFGFAWDENEEKSHLRIGSSETNPNLGTITMVDNEDQKKLTKVETLDVDMSYVTINGDTSINGVLRTTYNTWNSTSTSDVAINGENLKVWSTIVTPVGHIWNYEDDKRFFDDNGKASLNFSYDKNDNSLFSVHSYTSSLSQNNYEKQSKWYKGQNTEKKFSKSYLNVITLLEGNNIHTDYKTIFSGDAGRLTRRYSQKNDYQEILKLMKLQSMSVGIFEDTYNSLIMNNEDPTKIDKGQDWVQWYLDNGYGTNPSTILSDIKYSLNINIDHLKKVRGYHYTWQDSTDCVKCWNISNHEEIKWFPLYEIPGGYERIVDDNAIVVDTVGLKKFDFGVYLELSTDMTNKENMIVESTDETQNRKIGIGNPIQISYVDVPCSYKGKYAVSALEKIYTYMYVDGSHKIDYIINKNGDDYDYPKTEEPFTYYSYNEVWSCDGCDKCSQYSCSMIGMCNKSKVSGSYLLSYGFTTSSYIESYLTTNVYRYMHKRYGHEEDGTTYLYGVLSYYPLMETVRLTDGIEKRKEQTTVDIDGVEWYMYDDGTFRRDNGNGDPRNDVDIPKTCYVGKNILCDFQDEWIYKNAPSLDKEYEYSYSTNNTYIITRYKGEDPEKKDSTCQIGYTTTYWNLPKSIKWNDTSTGNYHEYDSAYVSNEVKKNTYMQFSYYKDIEEYIDYDLSYRYVNIREVLTNHSAPEFYNGQLYTIGANDKVIEGTYIPEAFKDNNEYQVIKTIEELKETTKPSTHTTFAYLGCNLSYINGVVDENSYVMTFNDKDTTSPCKYPFTIESWTAKIQDKYEPGYDGNTYYWKKVTRTNDILYSYAMKVQRTPVEPTINVSGIGDGIYSRPQSSTSTYYNCQMTNGYKIYGKNNDVSGNWLKTSQLGTINISQNANKSLSIPIDVKYIPRNTTVYDLSISETLGTINNYATSSTSSSIDIKIPNGDGNNAVTVYVETCKHEYVDMVLQKSPAVFCDVLEKSNEVQVSTLFKSELVEWVTRDNHKYAVYRISQGQNVTEEKTETWIVRQREPNKKSDRKQYEINITIKP